MNLPNRLTLLRVLLIPVFVVLLLYSGWMPEYAHWFSLAAVLVFIAASVTDFLDGHIARKYGLITNFGKFMDPLADKLLVCSALITLVHLERIETWIVLVIVAREFTISGFRLVAAEQGLVLAASKMAKVKTTVQMILVILLVINLPSFAEPLGLPWLSYARYLEIVMMYAALLLTVASLVEYLIKNRSVLKGQM